MRDYCKGYEWRLNGRVTFNGNSGGINGYTGSLETMQRFKIELTNLMEKFHINNDIIKYGFQFDYLGSPWDDEESHELRSEETKNKFIS